MLFGLELVAAGLLLTEVNSGAVRCSRQPPPPIRVIPSLGQIQHDHTLSQSDLTKKEIDTENPYGGRRTHVGGLMSGEIRVEHKVGFVQEVYEQIRQVCVHFDAITVNMEINPTIYIAREYQAGSCRYNAIYEHEEKHVEADRLVVNKYARRIGEALSFAINKYGSTYGPFPAHQVGDAQKRLQAYIDGIVKAEVDAMNAERQAVQQAIDSLEEYERVRRMCR